MSAPKQEDDTCEALRLLICRRAGFVANAAQEMCAVAGKPGDAQDLTEMNTARAELSRAWTAYQTALELFEAHLRRVKHAH